MRWFKHEADARNSLKLRKVRRKYGADGYAIYWFCLEAIAYEVDKDNLTFELKEDAETIGFELSIQEKRVEEIMMYMIEIGLFESSRNTITCLKLAERLDKTMTNSPKMRKWLETKSVMTSSDEVMTIDDKSRHCATSGELDKEVEVEVEVNKKNKDQRIEDAFNKFWISYHKKQGKAQALKAFKAAVKREGIKDFEEFSEMLITDCKERISAKQFGFDNLNGATYLNNNRWEDEKVQSSSQSQDERVSSIASEFGLYGWKG